MDRSYVWNLFVTAALICAGCAERSEQLRTFSEEHDGDKAIAVAAESADDPPAAAVPPEASHPKPDTTTPADSTQQPQPRVIPGDDAGAATLTELPRPPRVPLPERIAMLDAQEVAIISEEPRKIELLIPEKDFSRVDPNRSFRVSYDDLDLLKVLNMEPVVENALDYFPNWLLALNGQQVRIRGFMIPPSRETDLPGFTLARDNQICCFGRDPKAYDIIPVLMKDGLTTDYIPNRPFDVVGRFHINPDVFRGEIQTLYEIDEAEVISR